MQDEQKRYTGLVEKWIDERGFGFIRRDNYDGPSVFVHATAINGRGHKTLIVGQAVEFEIEPSDRGPRCIDVIVLEQAPA